MASDNGLNTLVKDTRNSLKRINWRLYFALLATAALPTAYTTSRIYFLGDLPAEWGVNIASQLTWINLGLEVVQEAIVLPLFFLLGKTLHDRKATLNKLKTGLVVVLITFTVLASLIFTFAHYLVTAMAQHPDQIPATVEYIRLEMIAAILLNSVKFLTVFFILKDWRQIIYTILGIQVFLSALMDTILLSQFSFSYNMGVNGIAIGNVVASTATLFYAMLIIKKRYRTTESDWRSKLDFSWLREWWSVGKWSGVDSLIRNVFFLLFIVRMINVVEEQGTFWVANGFIWGWLLLPFFPLADLVKQDTAKGKPLPHREKMLGYFATSAIIVGLWLLFLPVYPWFFENVFNTDSESHIRLVWVSLPFYVFFMINTTMDSVLYGRGKTGYLALQSAVTNVSVYGTAYVLYSYEIVSPTLYGIALLFGIGIMVDTIVTWWLYNRHIRQSEYAI